jgi:hypothetical protein
MKNNIKLTVLFTLLLLTACSDYLNEELAGTYTTENFYKTEEHALLAITGVYNITSFVSTNNAIWVFGDVASDDAIKGGSSGDQIDIQFLNDFDYSRNNGYLEKMWKHYYEGITRANYLLYYGNDIAMDPDLKARILGEAKFLRAYFYFNLVNIFGEVPLKLLPPLNTDLINIGKSSTTAIYEQIEKDLREAEAVIPAIYSGQANTGRITKGAALGLLSKVHLYQNQWEEALTQITALEALNIYSLVSLYSDNFSEATEGNAESIYEIQHLSGQIPMLGNHLNQYFGSPDFGGYFFNVPTPDFVAEFEVLNDSISDPRLDYTVGRAGKNWVNGEPFDPTWSPSGFLQKKHVQSTLEAPISGDAGLNYTYMRYADILLMKAEALNELNRISEAIVPLNLVRKRARESYLFDAGLNNGNEEIPEGLLPDVALANQSIIRDKIRHERRVELGFEFHRFFDLIRYGSETAEAALDDTNFNYDVNKTFLIPQSEIDTNTKINQ